MFLVWVCADDVDILGEDVDIINKTQKRC